MKNRTLIITAVIAIVIYSLSSCGTGEKGKPGAEDQLAARDTSAKRGGYLVTIMGCNDCHSPRVPGAHGPELDAERILSGYPSNVSFKVPDLKHLEPGSGVFDPTGTAFTGPWGTSFASNLTSDGTGIGNWSLVQFKNAFSHGKFMGINEERMIMPPMPWQNYTHIEEADLKAIFAYLKSTKPVHNSVHAYMPPGAAK